MDIDRDIATLTDIDAIISATPRPGLKDRVRSFGSRFVRVKQVLPAAFSFGSRAIIITFIYSSLYLTKKATQQSIAYLQ